MLSASVCKAWLPAHLQPGPSATRRGGSKSPILSKSVWKCLCVCLCSSAHRLTHETAQPSWAQPICLCSCEDIMALPAADRSTTCPCCSNREIHARHNSKAPNAHLHACSLQLQCLGLQIATNSACDSIRVEISWPSWIIGLVPLLN